MTLQQPLRSRRGFLNRVGLGVGALLASRFFVPGAFAEEVQKRILTPAMTEGPFFPDKLPLDTDNDLLIINDALSPAIGEITHLSGRILDRNGEPIRNALIEIWQVDGSGSYLHSQGMNNETRKRDKNFQGYGRFLTASSGEYYFRTIKPVPYPGRTPHIHVKISAAGKEQLSTQFFVKGHPMNERDGVLRGVRDEAARQSVMCDFVALKDSKIGELAARCDVMLGLTPQA